MTKRTPDKAATEAGLTGRVAFFGSALDPDERHDAIREKRAAAGRDLPDPCDEIVARVAERLLPESWSRYADLPVPGWLRPAPPAEDVSSVDTARMVEFIDGEGCLRAAEEVRSLVEREILPDCPALIGVDHSLTGGVLMALSERLGPENLTVVVLDAHTDAIPVSATAAAVRYDAETNPRSVFDPEDPFLRDRPDSYNASSFLDRLLTEGVIIPQNLYLVGVADLPPSRAEKLDDPRIRQYVGAFASLKERGVKLIRQDDLAAGALRALLPLRRVQTTYTYVSVDLDVAAGAGVGGVRFTDRRGLEAPRLLEALEEIARALSGRSRLVGFDLTEFDPRKAALESPAGRTYEVAAQAATILADFAARSAAGPADLNTPDGKE